MELMVTTKYNFDVLETSYSSNIDRLTNQLWKLIPMRENNENWQEQLDTVIIEIAGLGEIFCKNDKFLVLLSKLEGLKKIDVTFPIYRKTVFESISLLREVVIYE